jgi:acyl-coenzyme A thioesterase PaaI-like protein
MAALDVNPFGPGQPCFGCSQDHPFGFRLRFAREGDEVTTTFTPDDRYQGPPGIMHGGLVATLADEVAAWAIVGLLEKFGFTAQLVGRLHKPIRIGIPVEGRAHITRNTPRLVASSVRLIQNGEAAFTGDFSFVLVDQFSAEKLLGGPLPEAWKKFCR